MKKSTATSIALIVIVMTLFTHVSNHFRWGFDSTDDRAAGVRSGMKLYTDHGTGCQYLGRPFTALQPRLAADGTQVCTPSR